MHYPSAQTCHRHVLLKKTQDSRVLIIQRGTSTETTAQSARGGWERHSIRTVLYFASPPYYLNILPGATFEQAFCQRLYTGDLREMNHCEAAVRAAVWKRLGRREEPLWLMRKQSEQPSPPSPSRFTSSVSSLEPSDFNLSKLFTSMPPRLLPVCQEGADR